MGQKVNPIGLRLGINRTWDSRWFADDDYAPLLQEDLHIRDFLYSRLAQAGVSRIVIERPAKKARVTIHTARPGVVIGKKGADIEKIRQDLGKLTKADVHLNIVEIRKPEIDAKLVAEGIAQQLERRVSTRRAMKRAVQSAMRLGAQGIRINCGGRLGGADVARSVWYREGRVARQRRGPPTACAASRCGSTRATSSRTTRWRSTGGRWNSIRPADRRRGVTGSCSVRNERNTESSTRAAFTAPRKARPTSTSAPSDSRPCSRSD